MSKAEKVNVPHKPKPASRKRTGAAAKPRAKGATHHTKPRLPYIPAPPQGRMRNRLLETYLDPERYPGVRYPDNYSRATATSQMIDTFNPFVFPTGSVVEAPGTYYAIARASLVHPLWSYGASPSPFPFLALSEQSSRFGVRPLDAGKLCPSIQDDQAVLQENIVYNLALPKITSGSDWIEDPYLNEDVNGSNFYGHTMAFGTGTANLKSTFNISAPVAINDKLVVTYTNGILFITQDIVASAVGQTVFAGGNVDVTSLCVSDLTNQLGHCSGRAKPIGVRIKWVPVVITNIPSAVLVSAYVSVQGSAPPINQIGLFPIDFKDQGVFVAGLTSYRPISASLWTSYVGSALENGGEHACLMYRGGGHPNQIKLHNYKLISETRESYSDKARLGSYQFWLPASTRDTEMRLPVNSGEWEHPIMVLAGYLSNLTQVNPLRLRLVINFEFTSASTVWSYESVRPNPAMIQAASTILGGIPTSMSNDSHLENIYNWLKGAAKSTFNWIGDNKGWLIPALAAGAAAL